MFTSDVCEDNGEEVCRPGVNTAPVRSELLSQHCQAGGNTRRGEKGDTIRIVNNYSVKIFQTKHSTYHLINH